MLHFFCYLYISWYLYANDRVNAKAIFPATQ